MLLSSDAPDRTIMSANQAKIMAKGGRDIKEQGSGQARVE